jgi:hypothetical protein
MASIISLGQLFDKTISVTEKNAGHFIGIVTWVLVAALPAAVAKIFAMYGEIGSFSAMDGISVALTASTAVASFVLLRLYVPARLTLANAEASGEGVKDDHRAAWTFVPQLLALELAVFAIVVGMSIVPLTGILVFILQSTGVLGTSTALGLFATMLVLPGGVLPSISIASFLSASVSARVRIVLEKQNALAALKASLQDSKGNRVATAIRYYLPRLVYTAIVYIVTVVVLLCLRYTGLVLASIGVPAGFAVGLQQAITLLATTATALIGYTLLATNDYLLARSLKPRR